MKESTSFVRGPIFLPLIRFALPVLLALFLQALYGAADLFIAGQFGGELANEYVSAIASGSQLLHAITVVITGLAMGLTVALAEAIGAGHREEAARLTGNGVALFFFLSLVLSAVSFLLSPTLAAWLNVPPEAFDHTVSYIQICSVGLIFIVFYNLLGSIFRGIGDSILPLITVAIAAFLNIVLDYILIAIFHMGTAGAAIATVTAQAVSVLLSLAIIRRGRLPFAFTMKDIAWENTKIFQILRLGTPLAIQDLLVSLSFLVILVLVNGFGLLASAGVGAAEKVCAFIMLVPSAYMQSMAAFVGQNMGAGKPERARKALWYGIATSFAAGILIGGFTFFRGDLLASIFSQDPATIAAAFEYLKAYAIDTLLTSFLFCLIGYFNGCEETRFVMIQGIIGGVLVRIPLAWLFSLLYPGNLFILGLSTPCSTIVQIGLCLFWLSRQNRKAGLPRKAAAISN